MRCPQYGSFSVGPFPNPPNEFPRNGLSSDRFRVVPNDAQDGFSLLHYAALPSLNIVITCAPSPLFRLSRTSWPVVTPATTMSTPHPGARAL